MAALERASPDSSLVDVMDRVLDKGIVIDAWVRISLIGIELVTVQARVVVASIATYVGYSDLLADAAIVSPPTRALSAPPSEEPASPTASNVSSGGEGGV